MMKTLARYTLPTHITVRSNSRFYWYRQVVPVEYRPIVGRSEITFSLKSDKLKEVKQWAKIANASIKDVFDELELILKEEPDLSDEERKELAEMVQEHVGMIRKNFSMRVLTESDIATLIAKHRQTELEELDQKMQKELPKARRFMRDEMRSALGQQGKQLIERLLCSHRERVLTLKNESISDSLRGYLERDGICELRSDAALLTSYRTSMAKALLEISTQIIDYFEGAGVHFLDDYEPFLDREQSWEVLLNEWRETQKPSSKCYQQTKSNIEEWVAFTHGILPIFTTKAHVNSWIEHLIERRTLSPTTLRAKVGLIRAVFNKGVELGRLNVESNPFEGVNLPKESRLHAHSRQPFLEHHLRSYFSSAEFCREKDPTLFWVSLIALTSGARLEEIAQLSLADIKTKQGRLWFSFNDLEADRSIKNSSSCREVPVHQELLKIGLQSYIKQLKEQKERRLFPALKPSTHGSYSKVLSNKLGRYIDKQVTADRAYTFHSLRHNFRDFAINSDISHEITNVFTGHVLEGMAERYGKKNQYGRRVFSDAVLIKAMDTLHFGGLDLSHLYLISSLSTQKMQNDEECLAA